MSSVSSVGNNSLYQWLQQLTGNQQTSATTAATTPTAQDPFEALSGAAQGLSGQHHHHHGGFAQKIESSVTTALQNAPAGSDPNQVIKDAIAQALKASQPGAAGNDGDADDQASASGNSTASGSTTLSALGSANGNSFFSQLLQSDGVTGQQFQQDLQSALAANQSSSGSTAVSGVSSNDAAFNQLLQSNGISPQQFQLDLQDALSTSQPSGFNFAALFKNFPPGSFFQTTG